MSLHLPPLARAALAPLLAAFCSGACATLLDPRPPLLRIRTDTVVATVRDAAGNPLGTTPLQVRLRARPRQTLVISAPGYDSAVVTIDRRVKNVLPTLLNPLSWPVDAASGAYWTHDPGVLDVRLSPAARVRAAGEVSDPVAAVVLAEFANAAEAAGCEPLLVAAWRDAARVLAHSDTPTSPPPDSVRAMAAAEVRRAAGEIRELCALPAPRVQALREIRETVAGVTDAAVPAAGGAAVAPVFFGPDQWEVRDDSVRARLRALGSRLADTPVTLVVEGFAQPGELYHRELGYQRALSVIRALRAGGLAADCCVVISHTGDPRVLAAATAAAPGLNRRVTLTLGYREAP